MPNLKKQKHSHLKAVLEDKHLVIFLAIILVVAINYVVFNHLLVDREKAGAFGSAWGVGLFTQLTGGNIPVGSTNVLIAEVVQPNAWDNDALTCNHGLGNACMPMVDANGIGAPAFFLPMPPYMGLGPGTDDDGIAHFYNLVPRGASYGDAIFKSGDNVCADSLLPPIEDVYVDGNGDCTPSNGGTDWEILDNSLDGMVAGAYVNVATSLATSKPWVHSDHLVNNGAWDYCGGPNAPGCPFNQSNTVVREDSGVCGINDGIHQVDLESVWDDLNFNLTYDLGEPVYWDPAGCFTVGACSAGGCSGNLIAGPNIFLFFDGPCPGGTGVVGDGIWQPTEPIWNDSGLPPDGIYTLAADGVPAYDPLACLAGGEPGVSPVNQEAYTETIWIYGLQEDLVLAQGSDWMNPVLGQWQGDLPGPWNGNEGFIDYDGDAFFGGIGSWAVGGAGDEPIIISLDNDAYYSDAPDTLFEADGQASLAIGANDDVIADGAPLTPLAVTDNVCINTFGFGAMAGQIAIYIDGTDQINDGILNGNGDCFWGNGGVDVILRDDNLGGFMAAPPGLWPNIFIPAQNVLLYYDDPLLPNIGAYDYGLNAAATESLWLEVQGLNTWTNAVESMNAFEADGVAGPPFIAGGDDDGLTDGAILTYLTLADGVCVGLKTGAAGIEDLYVDLTGDCAPFNDPGCVPDVTGMGCLIHPFILQDFTGDGLTPLTVYGGAPPNPPLPFLWSSVAGIAAYADGAVALNGVWDWGPGAPVTETLWIEVLNAVTYTSQPDINVYGAGAPIGGQALTPGWGPNGYVLAYYDTDMSGTLTATDTVVEDSGNVQTGPLGPGPLGNGVLDRRAESFDYAIIENAGTASGASDITLYVCNAGPNLWCDNPVGSIDDSCNLMTWSGTDWAWVDTSPTPGNPFEFGKVCITADISPAAQPGRTIKLRIPQLVDTGATPGLYDAGEKGVFVLSGNDGPTDAAFTLPYTFAISAGPSYGGGGGGPTADTTAPGNVKNIQITADYNGLIQITWTDPVDADLAKIMIDEDSAGNILTEVVSKDVEQLVLTGRKAGQIYTYMFRAQDISGNSSGVKTLQIQVPVVGQVVVTEPAEAPAETPFGPPAGFPVGVIVGSLVKSPDMPPVYYIGKDYKKHHFPNEAIYHSYYTDFSNISIISVSDLNSIETGGAIMVRPGTHLVKQANDPKCYAVEPGGVLRWIQDEKTAKHLYGTNWNARVLDLSAELFSPYSMGVTIADGVHPDASLMGYQGSTRIYYIEGGMKREVSSTVFSQSRYQDRFVAKDLDPSITYDTGAAMEIDNEASYF